MKSKNKFLWGEPRDWMRVVGGMAIVIGLLRLVSGVWTPDAIASAGSGNTLVAIVTIVVGLVIAAASFAIKPRA